MSSCSKCGGASSVYDSRMRDTGVIVRRRRCLKCGEKWTTAEVGLTRIRQLEKLEGALVSIRMNINHALSNVGEV